MTRNLLRSFLLITVAAITTLFFSSCQKELDDNTPNVRPLTAQEQMTIESSNDFAFRSFARLSEEEGAKNVFISPLSISMALTMTYNGAASATKEAMYQALGFKLNSDEEINKSFKDLSTLLKEIDKKVIFTSANSLWHNNQIKLQAPFVEINKNYFDAMVQGLDFSSPAAKDQVNNWVKNKTNGKIDEIVKEIHPDQILFLINAIYFKGIWTYPFDKQLTKAGTFHLEDGTTVTHDFMTMKNGRYLHYADASKEMVDLPYGNQQYSMTIVVPKEQHTVQEIVQDLNENNLASWLSSADTIKRELQMPKFKLAYENKLNQMLTQLGMGIAFGNQADFSRMVEGMEDLSISEVKHKTFLDVNEEGTEAAAVTSVSIEKTSVPLTIRIDRPFVFMIREKSTNAILFIGKLMQPE